MSDKINGFLEYPNQPGFYKANWEYNADVKNIIKVIPGVIYYSSDGYWKIPKELSSVIRNIYKDKTGTSLSIPEKKFSPFNVLCNEMRPFQLDGYNLLPNQHGGILAFDPGLGKSLPAIAASAEFQTLIISPPRNVMTWVREINKWLPEARVYAQKPGKDWRYKGEQFLIISNRGMTKLMKEGKLPDYFKRVIIDELQHFINYKAALTESLAVLLANHPEAMRIGLSGMLAPNRLHQIYQPIHCMWPFRFGTPTKFQDRYCKIEYSHGHRQIRGTTKDPELIEELKERYAGIAVMARKADWAHLLPSLNFSLRVVAAPEEYKVSNSANIEHDFAEHFSAVKKYKAAPSVDIALELIESGVERICIGAWHKEVAHEIYDTLRHDKDVIAAGHSIMYVDGESHNSFDRETAIARFIAANPLAILVCTQASTMEGMNELVAFDHVIPAEIYWKPGVLIQWCARFHRLNSTSSSVTIIAPYCKGTKDEQIISVVSEKMEELSSVLGSDTTGSMFLGAIDTMRQASTEELYQSFNISGEGETTDDSL